MGIKEKLSPSQLGLLLFTFIVSTIILTAPGTMVMTGKQDAWLSVIPAAASGLLSIWVMILLANRYPGLTIIEYSSKILGNWLGKCLGVYYVYFWLMSISVMITQHTKFVRTLLLPTSPSIVLIMSLLLLAGLAVYSGIEVIARCNEFLLPLILLCCIPLYLLMLKEADPNRILPILNHGLLPVLQGIRQLIGSIYQPIVYIGLAPSLFKSTQKSDEGLSSSASEHFHSNSRRRFVLPHDPRSINGETDLFVFKCNSIHWYRRLPGAFGGSRGCDVGDGHVCEGFGSVIHLVSFY